MTPHENTDDESSSIEPGGRVQVDIRGETRLNMVVAGHSGHAVVMTCACCDGRGTVAVADGGELVVDSYGSRMKFREPDYEIMASGQASLADFEKEAAAE